MPATLAKPQTQPWFTHLLLLSTFLHGPSAPASEPIPSSAASPSGSRAGACFSWDQRVDLPLRPRPGKTPLGDSTGGTAIASPLTADGTASGALEAVSDGLWGAAWGSVSAPLQALYSLLLDPKTIKDPEKVRFQFQALKKPPYLDFHVVDLSVSAILFRVEWQEEWAYALTAGTPQAPQGVTISYQKASGTRYLRHLCGSIVLTALTPELTDVYLYEEISAFGKRSSEDTVQGHLGTLQTLRKLAPKR
jgi:hypothetical protein